MVVLSGVCVSVCVCVTVCVIVNVKCAVAPSVLAGVGNESGCTTASSDSSNTPTRHRLASTYSPLESTRL
jgi:hypothetical protein